MDNFFYNEVQTQWAKIVKLAETFQIEKFQNRNFLHTKLIILKEKFIKDMSQIIK